MNDEMIHILIKINKEEYVHRLYEYGEIYLNTVNYFGKLEDKQLRGDKNEGATSLRQGKDLKVYVDGVNVGYAPTAQITFRNKEMDGNIYSMLAITSVDNLDDISINENNKSFGDSFVLIYNVKEFIDRVIKRLENDKFEYYFGMVKYYDRKSYEGGLTVFYKPNEFEYQKEFRIFVKRKSNEPLVINIGSIMDIAKIFNIDNLFKLRIEKPRDNFG